MLKQFWALELNELTLVLQLLVAVARVERSIDPEAVLIGIIVAAEQPDRVVMSMVLLFMRRVESLFMVLVI